MTTQTLWQQAHNHLPFKQYGELEILYRDEALVVINKPGGLLAVPGRGPEKQDCAVARLRRLLPDMIPQPAVHRLDLYTSGLMVLAMTAEVHRNLSRQFSERKIRKRYTAVVAGILAEDSGVIRLSFRLDPNNRPVQIYDPSYGKLGITHWQKIAVEKATTRLEFTPLTGRTHQLRVHAAHPLGLGTPVVGDSLYGTGCEGEMMMLHSTFLEFQHPITCETIEFLSPPPF